MDGFSPPFTVPVLELREEQLGFDSYLPAARRTNKDDIVVPRPDVDFLAAELLVRGLNDIQAWLWLCGRPMPPRPLHYQVLIARDIAITENSGLHLVWSKNRIFLKPLPPWLLDPLFWESHILQDAELARCARGFLFSYTALIQYESDFRLAKEHNLVPSSLTWTGWKSVVKEVLENHDLAMVNARYWYGELRLGRINTIYRLRGSFFRGYSRVSSHAIYADLLADNFAILATVLGYVVIVLTSLQVGLGVDRLLESTAFVDFSYGFTIFSIIAPLIAGVGILLFVLAMFASNWVATTKYEERRFKEMGVEPYWKKESGRAPEAKPMTFRTDSQGDV